jgi:hypothetical protein
MSNRSLMILGGVVVLLGLVYFILQRSTVPIAEEKPLLVSDSSEIDQFAIVNDLGTVRIERTDEGWQLVEPLVYPANNASVRSAIARFAELTISSTVTNNPERHSEFGVDSTAETLEIVTGTDTLRALIGRLHSGGTGNYARIPGEDRVLLAKGRISGLLRRSADNWRNRAIVNVPVERVYRYQSGKLDLVRTMDGEWAVAGADSGETLAGNAGFTRVFRTVFSLTATTFADDEQRARLNWSRPDHQFKLTLDSGETVTVRFIKDEKVDRYFAQSEGNEAVFIASAGVVDRIFDELPASVEETPEESRG